MVYFTYLFAIEEKTAPSDFLKVLRRPPFALPFEKALHHGQDELDVYLLIVLHFR